MDARLLRAVRCQIELCRRASDKTREDRSSRERPFPARRRSIAHVAGIAAILIRQSYYRPGGQPQAAKAAFAPTMRSKKTAAAALYLSRLLGAPLSVVAPGNKTFAVEAWCYARVARQLGLRHRPLRLVRAIVSITRSLDKTGQQKIAGLIFAYWNFRMLFSRWRPAFFLCVSDLSPRRIAAACAANVAQVPVLYFQDDWHHDIVPPFGTAAASILNGTGLRAVEPSLIPGAIVGLQGSVQVASGIRRCPRTVHRVGVALNNFFDLDELLALADRIARGVPEAKLIVRKHPRSRARVDGHRPSMAEAPAGQSIAEFAAMCDLVLVGNSAVQIGLLLAGVPVAHIGHLDKLTFDFYCYVSAGIVYGVEDFERLDLDSINDFYADGDWRRRFLERLDVASIGDPLHIPEEGLAKWLAATLSMADGEAHVDL